MPHFTYVSNKDGSVRQIHKDGQPYNKAVTLEPAHSIVSLYFKLATSNLAQMEKQTDSEIMRQFGIQSFLMSLTALEAFTNTYFRLLSDELGCETMQKLIDSRQGSLHKKISDLIGLTPDGPIVDQDLLIQQVEKLSRLRNDIVHPRWEPSSVELQSTFHVEIAGLVKNKQAIFEDAQFCREALHWCLLIVARVARMQDVSRFLLLWTGNQNLTHQDILNVLHSALPTNR